MKNKLRPELKEFDVDKYAALEDFLPEQWAQLIESRLRIGELPKNSRSSYAKVDPVLTNLIRQSLDATEQKLSEKIAINLQKYLIDTRANTVPFIDRFNSSFTAVTLERFWDFPLKPINKDVLGFTNNQMQKTVGAVVPLNGGTVMALQRAVIEVCGLSPDIESDVADSEASYIEWNKKTELPIDRIVDESKFYKIRHKATLSVDLRRSDKAILKDFQALLDDYRKSTGIQPPTITKNRLQRWFENKVMPYADLVLWSQWSGINLSDTELINLLLPGKIVNKPLKGTKEGYNDAFSYQTILALSKGF